MSPGSSSHSSLGAKSASIFSGTSSRRRGRRQRGRSASAVRPASLQQEHVVGIDVRPDAAAVARVRAHDVVEARIGDEAKALQQPMRRVVVQVDALHQQRPAGVGQRRQGAPRDRARAQRPALAGAHDQARLDVVARGEREQRARGRRRAARRRSAARTSSGFFCQCRRMNSAADRPPSKAIGRCGIHASLCDDHSMEITAPCVVSLTWRLADAQGAEIDELSRAGRVLLRRRRPARQGRGSARRPGDRLRDDAAPRARARLRRLRPGARVLRGARDLPRRRRRARHAVRRAAARRRHRRHAATTRSTP